MNSEQDMKDYEILGYRVKLCSQKEGEELTPDEVVEYVRMKANRLLDKMPQLDKGEIALLVALTIAQEKMKLQKDFCENVDSFHGYAEEALQFIEEVSPSFL